MTKEEIKGPGNELITYKEAAERCRVDEVFIRKAVRQRELRAIILGPKTHRIMVTELERWWKSKQMKGLMV